MSEHDNVPEIEKMIDDPIGLVNQRLMHMDKPELVKLILIAGNRLGTMMKGGEYENGDEAVIFLQEALDDILQAYEQASMMVITPNSEVGGSC